MSGKRYTVRRDTPEATATLRKIGDRITDMWGNMQKMQECVICDILRNFYKSECWVFLTSDYLQTFVHLIEKNGDLKILDGDGEEYWASPNKLEEILVRLQDGDTYTGKRNKRGYWEQSELLIEALEAVEV